MITELKQPEVIRAEQVVRDYLVSNIAKKNLPMVLQAIYGLEDISNDIAKLLDKVENFDWDVLDEEISSSDMSYSYENKNVVIKIKITKWLYIEISHAEYQLMDITPAVTLNPHGLSFPLSYRMGNDGILDSWKSDDPLLPNVHLFATDMYKLDNCYTEKSDELFVIHDGNILVSSYADDCWTIGTTDVDLVTYAMTLHVSAIYPNISKSLLVTEVNNRTLVIKKCKLTVEDDYIARIKSMVLSEECYKVFVKYVEKTRRINDDY